MLCVLGTPIEGPCDTAQRRRISLMFDAWPRSIGLSQHKNCADYWGNTVRQQFAQNSADKLFQFSVVDVFHMCVHALLHRHCCAWLPLWCCLSTLSTIHHVL